MKMTALELARVVTPVRVIESKAGRVEVREIVEGYAQGFSINRLSYELGLTERVVRGVLVGHGVVIRNKSQAAIALGGAGVFA